MTEFVCEVSSGLPASIADCALKVCAGSPWALWRCFVVLYTIPANRVTSEYAALSVGCLDDPLPKANAFCARALEGKIERHISIEARLSIVSDGVGHLL